MRWTKYDDCWMLELSDTEAIILYKEEGVWTAEWQLARADNSVLCSSIVISLSKPKEAKEYCEKWIHKGRITCIKNKMVEITGDLGVLSRALAR